MKVFEKKSPLKNDIYTVRLRPHEAIRPLKRSLSVDPVFRQKQLHLVCSVPPPELSRSPNDAHDFTTPSLYLFLSPDNGSSMS